VLLLLLLKLSIPSKKPKKERLNRNKLAVDVSCLLFRQEL
jgi:hypothetical protein